MTIAHLSLIIWLGGLAAGFVGSLTGLGGGVIIIPLLTLILHFDIRYAIGASLVSVIATSSGAAAAYIKEGFTNIRIGILLEVATTLGALSGATLAVLLAPSAVAAVFGLVLLFSAGQNFFESGTESGSAAPNPLSAWLELDGRYPVKGGWKEYHVQRVPFGFLLMYIAGALSGLLGIGSGAIKVLAMDRAMRIPFKVSTTTSNFMIGVTAAASAGTYLRRGYIDPTLAMPVMLGVLPGAFIGSKLIKKTKTARLRLIFALVIAVLGLEMLYGALVGKL